MANDQPTASSTETVIGYDRKNASPGVMSERGMLENISQQDHSWERSCHHRDLGQMSTILMLILSSPIVGGLRQLLSSLFQRLLVSEMIIRAAKHSFKIYMQGVGMVSLSVAISHFLNCFLGSLPNPQPPKADDEVSTETISTNT